MKSLYNNLWMDANDDAIGTARDPVDGTLIHPLILVRVFLCWIGGLDAIESNRYNEDREYNGMIVNEQR